METTLTVKVTPPQSTWESAIPMIDTIKRDAKRKHLADKLNIEVGDVFKVGNINNGNSISNVNVAADIHQVWGNSNGNA